jgi:hypothetical protein
MAKVTKKPIAPKVPTVKKPVNQTVPAPKVPSIPPFPFGGAKSKVPVTTISIIPMGKPPVPKVQKTPKKGGK